MLKTLKQVMEEKLDSKNVQLASVTKDKGFRIYTDDEMEEVVGRLPTNSRSLSKASSLASGVSRHASRVSFTLRCEGKVSSP